MAAKTTTKSTEKTKKKKGTKKRTNAKQQLYRTAGDVLFIALQANHGSGSLCWDDEVIVALRTVLVGLFKRPMRLRDRVGMRMKSSDTWST